MAHHVWSVLCEKLLTDDSNVISLVSVIEKVIIHQRLDEIEKQLGDAIGFLYPMRLVTWCVRSNPDKPESFELRIGWLTPAGGRIAVGQNRTSLEELTGVRANMILRGIPWRGPGRYWLVVDKRDEGKKWGNIARLPVDLAVNDPENSESEGSPES